MSAKPSAVHQNSKSILHAREPSFAEVIGPSLGWGLVCAVALLVLLAGASFTLSSYTDRPFGDLMTGFAVMILVLYPVIAFGWLLWFSRTILAKTFGFFALGATLFGLVMLVMFFASIAVNTYRWLTHTTETWRASNNALQAIIDDPDTHIVKPKLAKVDDDEREALRLAWLRIETRLLEERAEKLALAKTEQETAQAERDYQDALAEAKAKFKDFEVGLKKRYDRVRERRAQEVRDSDVPERVNEARMSLRPDTGSLAAVRHFMTTPPSNKPESAGIYYALIGSIFMALIVIVAAVPLGVGAAVYLEEYKSRGWFSQLIQINISNLAGVPSIIFGILGAYVFVEKIFKPMEFYLAGLPVPADSLAHYRFIQVLGQVLQVFGVRDVAARNVLSGGLTLALLTLPVVIVAAQEAIRAVPQSIRHGALALGATRWQVVAHHVLPNSLPGILTGTILAVSRAIGEAAPLVLFGALLFVDYTPDLFSRFTVLPMQIFGWTDRPQEAWRFNAGAASFVLLVTLLTLNSLAIYLRQRAQRHMKW